MRTRQDTEYIVTNSQIAGSTHEYILVCIQQCKFGDDEGDEEEEEAEMDSDWYDYVFDGDNDAICKADYKRSESDYIKKYSKIIVEEEFKKRGRM